MIYLVNDLLSFAQINAGKFRKEVSIFNIRNSVKEVMLIQEHKAAMMDITLTSEFKGFNNIMTICSDEQRLQQVLLNFQSNALKFTPRGGWVKITVELQK